MATNSTYWADRASRESALWLERNQRQWTEQLKSVYHTAARKAQLDLLETCAKLEVDGKGDGILINDLYRSKRYKALIERLSKLLKDLGGDELRIIEPAILDSYREAMDALDTHAPKELIDYALFHPSALDGKQVALQAWCADGLDFSGRVWKDKERMLKRLERGLAESVINGKSPYQTATELAKDMGVGERSAYRLMRTETAHAQIAGQVERYRAYGYTTGRYYADPSCCPHCQELEGKVFPIDQFTHLIPNHPNCTCSMRPMRGGTT